MAEGAQVVPQRGIAYCCSVLLLHNGILIFESNRAALLVLSFSSTRWPKHAFKLSRRSETNFISEINFVIVTEVKVLHHKYT